MKTAILSPLAMGSRGRYTLVDGIAVGFFGKGRTPSVTGCHCVDSGWTHLKI